MADTNTYQHSFYAVLNDDTGEYFAGFDPENNKSNMVASPLGAKLFTNKNQVKLRPNERLVEIEAQLSAVNTVVSEPFRPRRREPKVYAK